MFGLKFLAIMRRDLKKLTRNPITLISVILMPIVYLVIIGNSFQGQLKHLPIVVVEQDHGLFARRIVEQLLALQAGPKTVDVTFENDPGNAVDEVRDGLYKGVVVIPPDFSHDVAEGRIAQIGLFTDNVDSDQLRDARKRARHGRRHRAGSPSSPRASPSSTTSRCARAGCSPTWTTIARLSPA